MFMLRKKTEMPSAADALPGRQTPIPTASKHFINQRPLKGPYPEGLETAMFGFGCFWGAERKFWELGDGIHVTAVGYAAGHTPNPTYEEVCSRPHRPQRGRAGGLRSEEDLLREAAQDLLGKPRSRPRACARATTSARSTAPASTCMRRQRKAAEASKAMYDKALKAQRLRCHHHRDRRRAAVLLRRGLSPAVSGEESDGLLRARRHRRELPDRNRRRCA